MKVGPGALANGTHRRALAEYDWRILRLVNIFDFGDRPPSSKSNNIVWHWMTKKINSRQRAA
jgi:hypothetical protein